MYIEHENNENSRRMKYSNTNYITLNKVQYTQNIMHIRLIIDFKLFVASLYYSLSLDNHAIAAGAPAGRNASTPVHSLTHSQYHLPDD